jgi:hypothetical protein
MISGIISRAGSSGRAPFPIQPRIIPRRAPLTFLLASGRSASVFEVIERIRERIERPLLLQFDPHPSNVRDMSFLPSALPTDWQPTPGQRHFPDRDLSSQRFNLKEPFHVQSSPLADRP